MITARTYGHSGFTSSAYYWEGIANNFSKLAQGGPVVEAAYLGGQQSSFSFPLSNLRKRRIDTYSNVTGSLRFDLTITGIISVIPCFNRRPMLVPTDATWDPYT